MEQNPCHRENIKTGMHVFYAINEKDSKESWRKGIVENIETPEDIPFLESGIKIRLTNGSIGFVKKILGFTDLTEQDILDLIRQEGKRIELKATFKVDLETQKKKDCLRDVIVREIAAFMNTDGGMLIIGVKDDYEIIGLGLDFMHLDKERITQPDEDKFTQEVFQYVRTRLKESKLDDFWEIHPIKTVKGKKICVIEINKSTMHALVDEEIQIFDCRKEMWKKSDKKMPVCYRRTTTGIETVDIRKIINDQSS